MTNETDALGWIAAALTLATFSCGDMARLRMFAVLANIAFVAYGASVSLWPVVALHSILLPLNLSRLMRQPLCLRSLLASQRRNFEAVRRPRDGRRAP